MAAETNKNRVRICGLQRFVMLPVGKRDELSWYLKRRNDKRTDNCRQLACIRFLFLMC